MQQRLSRSTKASLSRVYIKPVIAVEKQNRCLRRLLRRCGRGIFQLGQLGYVHSPLRRFSLRVDSHGRADRGIGVVTNVLL